MHLVYRVEHKDTKVGPFQTNDDYTQNLGERATDSAMLKAPGEDGLPLGHIPWSFVFGCLDVVALRRWFLLGDSDEANDAIILTLKRKGFVLAEYLVESDDCLISASGIQVAFSADDAREYGLVEYYDLDALLDERLLLPAGRRPIDLGVCRALDALLGEGWLEPKTS